MSVTGINAYGQATASSTATKPVAAVPPVNTTTPSITGTASTGSILTANPGVWTPAGSTFSYAWQVGSTSSGWKTISGATGSSYVLPAADAGLSVKVTVTATNVDGATSATSAATAPIKGTSGH